ncbi:MAG: hypothetical protein IKA87_10275 [Lentisphaeria bacterium]|nr:hypothetical protein [Lentisphaeria bacterium]
MWIKGDLHIHSHCCGDGTLSVADIVERSRKYCDFLAISGHCRTPEFFRAEKQYAEVVEARKKYDIPIFNTGEVEFPIPRHVIFITTPENREFEMLQSLVPRFCRRNGVEGPEKAMEELAFLEKEWGNRIFMIFNHPNAPDVSTQDLLTIADSKLFKVLACVDRGERRAPQTWDVGGAWDQLLLNGHKISVRCGSDFHRHYEDGGHDQYPGEFVQDCLRVKENSYDEIFKAYTTGAFYCMVGNIISNPVFCFTDSGRLKLEFDLNGEMEKAEIISDGRVIEEFTSFSDHFSAEIKVPDGKYFRVRGTGKLAPRKYEEGMYEPLFLLNPIYCD